MYPFEKYRYYTDGKEKVIAVSTYAGRIVRGVAKLHPGDSFDLEFGKKLAAAKCAVKIAKKRRSRAEKKMEEAGYAARLANRKKEKMNKYLTDATHELWKAEDFLESLIKG